MAPLSAGLRKALQVRTANDIQQLAQKWRLGTSPPEGWGEDFAELWNRMQNTWAVRNVWESLSLPARDLMHTIVCGKHMDGAILDEIRKEAKLSREPFQQALNELVDCVLVLEERPSIKVRQQMEKLGQKNPLVLTVPRDLRTQFQEIIDEMYHSEGEDRSR